METMDLPVITEQTEYLDRISHIDKTFADKIVQIMEDKGSRIESLTISVLKADILMEVTLAKHTKWRAIKEVYKYP